MAKKKYTIKTLKEDLMFDEKENYLLMPNEAIQMIAKTDELKVGDSSEHVAVAYSYLYLNTWMYRYAKYGQVDLEMTTVKAMKNIIGISPTGTSFDYIFKKNGVLDTLGLTETKAFNQAPVSWQVDESDEEMIDFMLFEDMSQDMKEIFTKGTSMKRRQIKYPVLGLEERTPLSDFECNGTFYGGGKDYTHQIPFEVFAKCMSTKDLGTIAFYLYSFIRSRYGANKKVQISLETIARDSGLKLTTVSKYIKLLRQYEMLGCKVENYVLGRDKYSNVKTEANTYWVYEKGFNTYKEEIAVREVISVFNLKDIAFSAEALAEKEKIWEAKQS